MKPRNLRDAGAASALAALLACAGQAASPTAWEMGSWQDFIKGRFEGLSLSREGRISLAPNLTPVFQSGQPMIWAVARAPGGDIYLGTGHQGKVYRVAAGGSGELLWTAPEPEVFALVVDSAGRLYAGTSPNGKVYLVESGKAAEYFAPGASYIWSLVFGADGAMYVGTGVEGKIFRVTGAGKGEVWYETGQSHVTSLAVDESRLLAGTEPNGILYRITAKDKAFVLHDAGLPEIRAIVPASGGVVYAAAMGGSVAKQTEASKPAAAAPVVSATVSSVTVSDTATQGGVEIKPQPPVQPASQAAATTTAAAPAAEYTGVEKSALYRIAPDNSVETIWSSKEENAYDLLFSKEGLVFTTDSYGRIYRLGPDRQVTLLAETREAEALRLMGAGDVLLIGTGNEGKLYRLGHGLGVKGVYESPVQDATKVARWGRLSWRAESCDGCNLSLRVRAGNSPRPDKTWSDWSAPLPDSRGSAVPAPNARYVQWKADFAGSSGKSPQLLSARLAYLPQNSAPEVKSITISSQSSPAPAKAAGQTAAAATYSITVTDTGETGASSLTGTPTQPVNRAAAEQLVLTWVAEDADGDRLTLVLEYRGAEEREWKLIKDDLVQNTYTIEADAFADGYYYFRVTASDRAGNPPADAREAVLVSPPVLLDRTPPAFKLGKPLRTATSVVVPFDVSDAASPLTRCESSLDGGPWSAQAPADGILDSQLESFQLRLEPPPAPGKEHVLVLRCADSASNPGLARVLLP